MASRQVVPSGAEFDVTAAQHGSVFGVHDSVKGVHDRVNGVYVAFDGPHYQKTECIYNS